MAVTDEARYQLYQRLETQLGHEEATTLMDHLPYGGWANLANKQDIVRVHERIDVTEKILRHEMAAGFERVHQQMDARFEKVYQQMDARFGKVDGQFAVMSEHIERVLAEGMAAAQKRQWQFMAALLTFLVAVSTLAAGLLAYA
jgi:hypothetical protein